MKKIIATLCVTAAAFSAPVLTATSASAAACSAAAPAATIKMRRDTEGKVYFAPVKVNGADKLMVVSTSMGTTTFFTEAVSAMKLPVTNLRGATLATANGSRGYDVTVATLGFGNAKLMPSVYLLFPPQEDGAVLYRSNIVGWLGLDALTQFDVDLDFPTSTMTLYKFEDCAGAPRAGAEAVTYTLDTKGRIIVPVNLDGKVLNAALDTSSDQDALNLNLAQETMGFNVNAPGVTKLAGNDAVSGAETYRARFGSMKIGNITVANPTLLVIQDRLRRQVTDVPVTGTNIRQTEDNRMPDLLIGNGFLSKYRVYIAAKEHKLYITPIR
jgi:predicted aspartyl protease